MKCIVIIFLGFLFPLSGEGQLSKVIPLVIDSSAAKPKPSEENFGAFEDDYFLVIADTSHDYYKILEESKKLSVDFLLDIDNLGRIYDPAADSILIPFNPEDEYYSRAYFLRRFPSPALSIEYLDAYQANSPQNKFALVAGIFKDEEAYNKIARELMNNYPNLYVLKTRIYLGCLH
jgi:hypothetical protein